MRRLLTTSLLLTTCVAFAGPGQASAATYPSECDPVEFIDFDLPENFESGSGSGSGSGSNFTMSYTYDADGGSNFAITAEITSGNVEIVFIGLLINDGDGGEYSDQHYPTPAASAAHTFDNVALQLSTSSYNRISFYVGDCDGVVTTEPVNTDPVDTNPAATTTVVSGSGGQIPSTGPAEARNTALLATLVVGLGGFLLLATRRIRSTR